MKKNSELKANVVMTTAKLMSLSLMILFMGFFTSCEDATAPENDAKVVIKSGLTNSTISKFESKVIEQLQLTNVDSVQIKKVRILLKEIKFHSNSESNESKDETFKTGPFVFVGDSTGTYIEMTNGIIPAGTYDKIKFEIHRFSSSDLTTYSNNANFKDFATSNRYTVIIEGISYINGKGSRFVYNSPVTANLSLKFEAPVVLEKSITTNIQLQINPADLFKTGNIIFDPNDSANSNNIDNLIKDAIKAVKKQI